MGPNLRRWEYRVGQTNTTPLNSLYIWAGLSLFTLEYGGRAAYMETHPNLVAFVGGSLVITII